MKWWIAVTEVSGTGSSPTRGMWIEISRDNTEAGRDAGHPPHGGCGLKYRCWYGERTVGMSSPTRGMWIEILWVDSIDAAETVIPHTGDVD